MLRAADGRTVAGVLVAGAAIAALLWRRRNNAVSSPQITTSLLVCSMCKTMQDKSCYTARQVRRHDHLRKCRRCVANYEDPPSMAAKRAQTRAAKKLELEEEERARREAATHAATSTVADSISDPLRLARKAETVLRGRTDRICLICENCSDDLNHVAILRTCEALGVHRVWLVEATPFLGDYTRAAAEGEDGETGSRAAASRSQRRHAARAAQRGFEIDPLLGGKRAKHYASHLDVRTFKSAQACIQAARDDGRALWVTDLAQEAMALGPDAARRLAEELPPKVAVVVGSEGAGVSRTMLDAADRRIFLPMYGFTESFNISVAAALVLQRLLDACDESRGKLPADEMGRIRSEWYAQLARSDAQRAEFAELALSGGVEPFCDTRRPESHREEQRARGIRKAAWNAV